MHLRPTITVDNLQGPEREYELFAVVIHLGSGPNHGHYVALIRSHKHWLLFDDDTVSLVDETYVQGCFGSSQDNQGSVDSGYLLFYQAIN